MLLVCDATSRSAAVARGEAVMLAESFPFVSVEYIQEVVVQWLGMHRSELPALALSMEEVYTSIHVSTSPLIVLLSWYHG